MGTKKSALLLLATRHPHISHNIVSLLKRMPNISGTVIAYIKCGSMWTVLWFCCIINVAGFFAHPLSPSLYYSVYIYHPPGICGRGKNTSISGGSVCLILVLYLYPNVSPWFRRKVLHWRIKSWSISWKLTDSYPATRLQCYRRPR
jgi:hypothetical protein